ncbi:Uncharacterised protein [Bordetella pertussis]|nr:Uncharacterised protein [Bordetella pertussis]
MDFLPRLAARKYDESAVSFPSLSFRNGGPQARVSSPTRGRSTLTTSAPMSASVWVAQGPARMRVKSRTLMCPSAVSMSVSPP